MSSIQEPNFNHRMQIIKSFSRNQPNSKTIFDNSTPNSIQYQSPLFFNKSIRRPTHHKKTSLLNNSNPSVYFVTPFYTELKKNQSFTAQNKVSQFNKENRANQIEVKLEKRHSLEIGPESLFNCGFNNNVKPRPQLQSGYTQITKQAQTSKNPYLFTDNSGSSSPILQSVQNLKSLHHFYEEERKMSKKNGKKLSQISYTKDQHYPVQFRKITSEKTLFENKYFLESPQKIQKGNLLRESSESNLKGIHKLNNNIDDLFFKIQQLKQQCDAKVARLNRERENDIKEQNPQEKTEIADKQKGKQEAQTHCELTKEQVKQFVEILKRQSESKLLVMNQKQRKVRKLTMKEFELGKKVGSGKFGDVFMCRHKRSNTFYALKKILKSTINQYNMVEQFTKELRIHYEMSHENIVQLITHFEDEYHIFLLMEYAEGGTLMGKLNCPESAVADIVDQVISGVEYIHSKDIVHRDIKPENIVICFNNTVKLCDFGWAGSFKHKGNSMKKSSTFCGTPDYVSPEMKDVGEYDFSVDLWSIGVLTYQLAAGYPPFKQEVIHWVKTGVKKEHKWNWNNVQYPSSFSLNLRLFVSGLLKQNPELRNSLSQCRKHTFIRSFQSKKNTNTSD